MEVGRIAAATVTSRSEQIANESGDNEHCNGPAGHPYLEFVRYVLAHNKCSRSKQLAKPNLHLIWLMDDATDGRADAYVRMKAYCVRLLPASVPASASRVSSRLIASIFTLFI